MPLSLTSRELFKSYPNSLVCPIPRLQGKPFNVEKAEKNWVDTYLLDNPTFVGKANLRSPQGLEVVVTYGKNFVTYPQACQEINGQWYVEEFICSREDAVLFNLKRGDEGTATIGSKVPAFKDIPWDRPLADSEVIKRLTSLSAPQVFDESELVSAGSEIMNDTTERLKRIELKIDNLASLIK